MLKYAPRPEMTRAGPEKRVKRVGFFADGE